MSRDAVAGTIATPDPPRLGGMAFANGVLVHGPRFWACAMRTESGELELASGPKLRLGGSTPVVRGLARVAEAVAALPSASRALPGLRAPYRDRQVLAALAFGLLATALLRRSPLSTGGREAAAAALSLAPALAAVRSSPIAAYHGAEHVAIGSWEHGEPRPRAHERCGSHLVVPMIATTVAGNLLVDRLARTRRGARIARALVGAAAVGVSVESFAWALRHPGSPLARGLAWPGTQLQQHLLTAEPGPAELEVAQAALDECLRLEARG